MPQTRSHIRGQRQAHLQRRLSGQGLPVAREEIEAFQAVCRSGGRVEEPLQWCQRGLNWLCEGLPEDRNVRRSTLERKKAYLLAKLFAFTVLTVQELDVESIHRPAGGAGDGPSDGAGVAGNWAGEP